MVPAGLQPITRDDESLANRMLTPLPYTTSHTCTLAEPLAQALATGCEWLRGAWPLSDLPLPSEGNARTLLNGDACRCAAGDGKHDVATDAAELANVGALGAPLLPAAAFTGVVERSLVVEPLLLEAVGGMTKEPDFRGDASLVDRALRWLATGAVGSGPGCE